MKKAIFVLCLLPLLGQAQIRNYYQSLDQQLATAQKSVRTLVRDTAAYRDTVRGLRRLVVLKDQRLDRQTAAIRSIQDAARRNASRGGFLGIGNRRRWRQIAEEIQALY